MLTSDQIDEQSHEETCENERTEQMEEQICGGQSEILVEKIRNEGCLINSNNYMCTVNIKS